MENIDREKCRYCDSIENGKFSAQCGQPLIANRISVSSITHEVFHFFTHFDKGFPFTLKKLLLEPGTMQKVYVNGDRKNFQKPFSMFFLCASFTALMMYLFFRNSQFNFAEMLVMQLYLFSFLFLLLSAIHLLKFAFPELQTRYIELPAVVIYCLITNLNFFDEKKSMILLKTIATIGINFFVASSLQDWLIGYLG